MNGGNRSLWQFATPEVVPMSYYTAEKDIEKNGFRVRVKGRKSDRW